MTSPSLTDAAIGGVPRMPFGRLAPLPGVVLRQQPDRKQLRQFLHELQLPLQGLQSMIDLATDSDQPQPVRVALVAAANHGSYLRELVTDFDHYGQLEADLVEPASESTMLRTWLHESLAEQRQLAEALGLQVRPVWRSFLPSEVLIDGAVAAQALSAVMRVALHRAVPSCIDLRIAYEEARGGDAVGRLVFELETRGGGFREVELGYVFAPFLVRDPAARPLLGLSIGHRLCELLGGELRVDSPDTSRCTYRITLAADPATRAVWFDPLDAVADFGPVRPGRVLFVGSGTAAIDRCRVALECAGYSIEREGREELAMSQLLNEPGRWSAVVLDASCEGPVLPGFIDAIRAQGIRVPIVGVLDEAAEVGSGIPGSDATVRVRSGREVLVQLSELRRYSDRKNASSAS